MPRLTTHDGVELHYTDEGSGPTILFLTGWAMSGNWWQQQRDHFRHTNRVIVLDPRAQGDSEPVLHGHRLGRHAADLRDLFVALDLSEVVVVAWSRSTSVLMSYLELFGSGSISKAVLCGFLPSLARRPDWPWGFNVPPQAFIDSVALDFPRVVSNMIIDMTHQDLDPRTVARLTADSLKTPPIAAARMLEDHMNVDWRDLLPQLDIPILICAGAEDPQAPLGAATATAELIPDAHVELFADSGHCVFIEEPERFNAVLTAFAGRSALVSTLPPGVGDVRT